MSTGIYQIRYKLTGEIYVGSSARSIQMRWKNHVKDLKGQRHHNTRLQNIVNKHGIEALEFSVLEECEQNQCITREQFYIDTLSPQLNVCRVAGNCAGRVFSEQSRRKMSESAKKAGLSQALLLQQKPKNPEDCEGNRICLKCSEKKKASEFPKKGSSCKICFNSQRPSRSVLGARLAYAQKMGVKVLCFKGDFSISFFSIRDATRWLQKEDPKANKTALKKALEQQKVYKNYEWRAY